MTCTHTQVALGSPDEVMRFETMVGYSEPYGVVSKDDANWVHSFPHSASTKSLGSGGRTPSSALPLPEEDEEEEE